MIDRFARIFTAYVPALILVAAVNAVMDLGQWGQDGTSTGPLAFVGNLLLFQDYPVFQVLHRVVGDLLYIRPYNTAEPFWTIPIEFWIYAVFGLTFFGLIERERLSVPLVVLLLAVALPVVIWNASAGGGNGLSLVWLVGAGAAYLWSSAWHRAGNKRQLGIVMLLAGIVCLLGRGAKIGWNFQDVGMAVCEALVLLGALSLMEGIRTLPVRLRGLCAFLASYSYSLYLVQNTVLVVLRQWLADLPHAQALGIAILLTHATAFLMYLLFERHYRQVGAWLKRREAVASGRAVRVTG